MGLVEGSGVDWQYYVIFARLYVGVLFLLPQTIAMYAGMIERRNSSEFYRKYNIFSKWRLGVISFGLILAFVLPTVAEFNFFVF